MVEKRRRPGRPTRAEALAKTKDRLEGLDPREILMAIAANPQAPATARVAACKALMPTEPSPAPGEGEDAVTQLALHLLKGGKK